MAASVSALLSLYGKLKKLAKANIASDTVAELLIEITLTGHAFLRNVESIKLRSSVPGKEYFSFRDKEISRPINRALFVANPKELRKRLADFAKGRLDHLQSQDATRTLYTLAMTFCAANDVTKRGDKVTPATYFECLIGHMFAVHLGTNPTKSIQVLAGDMKGRLPTDFIFDLGPKKRKFHVPIKLSTRERVIQIWAHQRVLDGIYGVGRYKGILVCLTETKLNSKTLEVVEICLPDQWRVYQLFIAQLTRVYYLDVPTKYGGLAKGDPKIDVKELGQFFSEAADL